MKGTDFGAKGKPVCDFLWHPFSTVSKLWWNVGQIITSDRVASF